MGGRCRYAFYQLRADKYMDIDVCTDAVAKEDNAEPGYTGTASSGGARRAGRSTIAEDDEDGRTYEGEGVVADDDEY